MYVWGWLLKSYVLLAQSNSAVRREEPSPIPFAHCLRELNDRRLHVSLFYRSPRYLWHQFCIFRWWVGYDLSRTSQRCCSGTLVRKACTAFCKNSRRTPGHWDLSGSGWDVEGQKEAFDRWDSHAAWSVRYILPFQYREECRRPWNVFRAGCDDPGVRHLWTGLITAWIAGDGRSSSVISWLVERHILIDFRCSSSSS